MKGLKKAAGVLLSIMMMLIILLLCVFLFWPGPAVKLAAETVGSKALGAPLTIDKLTIYPLKGTLHLSGFRIANPENFGRSNIVSLASLDIAMDMASLFSQTVVVHQVEINRPYFTYEQGPATDNITECMLSIQEFLGIDRSISQPDTDHPEKERKKYGKRPKRVLVESLVIDDARCHLANTDDPRLDIDGAVGHLALSMTNGVLNLKNLCISNPEQLEIPNLFTLDAVDIVLDPKSIYSDTISILDIHITRPYAYLEHNPQTDTVSEFMKITEKFAAKTNAWAKQAAATPDTSIAQEPVADPPPVALHKLLIDDIQIKLMDATATNAPVDPVMLAGIDSVSVRLIEGAIQIAGITIPNPVGFVSSNLFHLANIDITLEPDSIFSPQTVIQEVFIHSPTINLEQTETSGNVHELKETLMGFVPPPGVAEGAPTPEAAPQAGERPEPIPPGEQPLVLQSLVVTNLAINLFLPGDTNAPASGSINRPDFTPLEDMPARSINLPGRLSNSTTNQINESGNIGNEPMKLVAFGRLDAVPLEGTIQISNLQISNPRGFANRHMVTLEQFKLDLDPDSLRSDTLLISEILFDKPRIAYERKIAADNIKALQDEIKKTVSRREEYIEKDKTTKRAGPPEDEAAGQKVIIDHLLVQDGLVKAKISALPSTPIPLPDIEMKDMGKAEGGISPRQAVYGIGTVFYDAIIGSVSGATGLAGDALKGAGSMTLGTLDNVTGLLAGKSPPTAGHEVGTPAVRDASEADAQAEEPAEEKKPRRRLFRRATGRFF